jgi:hypothetical protein
MAVTLSSGLLVLRLVVGLTIAAHGAGLVVDVIGLIISRPAAVVSTEVKSGT